MSIWGSAKSAASWYWRTFNANMAAQVVRGTGEAIGLGWGAGRSMGIRSALRSAAGAGAGTFGRGFRNWAWRGQSASTRAVRLGTIGTTGITGLGAASIMRRDEKD